jgi:tetratricopeptide (TPR) repeat protein
MSSQATKRQSSHNNAKLHLLKDELNEAEEILKKTLLDYGPHVGVIADLATVYYQQGKIDHFENEILRLHKEYELCKSALSRISFLKTTLLLAKLFEEIGEVAISLKYYDEIIFQSEGDIEWLKKAKVQKLRLLSYYNLKKDIEKYYFECMRLANFDEMMQVELEHGLMIAEYHLFGIESALARYKSFIKKNTNFDLDKILFLSELAEIILTSPLEIVHDIDFQTLADGDTYDKILLNFIQDSNFSLPLDQINELSSEITKTGLLRIMNIARTRNQNTSSDLELNKKALLLLDSISHESREILLSKWRVFKNGVLNDESREILIKDKSIIWNNQEIDTSLKIVLMKTLKFFELQSEGILEDYVQFVFDSKINDSSNDRVRINFTRINNFLLQHTGEGKTLVLSKGKVYWNSKIKLTHSFK